MLLLGLIVIVVQVALTSQHVNLDLTMSTTCCPKWWTRKHSWTRLLRTRYSHWWID